MAKNNARVILKSRPPPNTKPSVDNFGYEDFPFPNEPLQSGHVLLKTLYLSVDPTLRFALNESNAPSYLKRWEINQTVTGIAAIGHVEKSNSPNFKAGDSVVVSGLYPWQLYAIVSDESIRKIDERIVSARISLALSLFGASSGLTSLLAIWEKGHIKKGTNQTFVVSGAAGACGSLAGQIARLEGVGKVVGICGSADKCKYIKDLGFDAAINYKTDNVKEKLKEACPKGIDIYFDNVGGDISDTVIEQMTPNSHIILCGQISQYDNAMVFPFPVPEKVKSIIEERKITRERYLVLEYAHRFEEGRKQLGEWAKAGKLQIKECFEEGLKNAPLGFIKMLRGDNTGKQLIHVADP